MKNIIKKIEPRLIGMVVWRQEVTARSWIPWKKKVIQYSGQYRPGETHPALIELDNTFILPDDENKEIAFLFETGKEIYEENGEIKVKRFIYGNE